MAENPENSTPASSKRKYVVLLELKASDALPETHLTIVGLETGHDREVVIQHVDNRLQKAGVDVSGFVYRAIPLTQFAPPLTFAIEKIERRVIRKKRSVVKAPQLPVAPKAETPSPAADAQSEDIAGKATTATIDPALLAEDHEPADAAGDTVPLPIAGEPAKEEVTA